MSYLSAAYNQEITTERAAVYWDQLAGLRDEAFMAAVRVAVGNEKRFPTVARLRELYREELRRVAMSARRPSLPAAKAAETETGRAYLSEIKRRVGTKRGKGA